MYIESFSDAELMEVAKESIAIIKGKSIHSGTKPFYYGKCRLKNQLVFAVQYKDKNISMFNIIKDWDNKGKYILNAEYINYNIVFAIPFTSKTSIEELYQVLKNRYQEYDKNFVKYKLELTDSSYVTIRTNWDIKEIKNYYLGKWYKDNKWYGLLAVLDCDIYPRCNNIVAI